MDAAARTAFQKGFEVSVVSDGTLGLERTTAEALAFMERFYDARIATASEVAEGWRAAADRPADRDRSPIAASQFPSAVS